MNSPDSYPNFVSDNPTVYSANPNQLDLSVFKSNYIDSGIISLALSQGCTTLLLAPNDVPPRFVRDAASRGAAVPTSPNASPPSGGTGTGTGTGTGSGSRARRSQPSWTSIRSFRS